MCTRVCTPDEANVGDFYIVHTITLCVSMLCHVYLPNHIMYVYITTSCMHEILCVSSCACSHRVLRHSFLLHVRESLHLRATAVHSKIPLQETPNEAHQLVLALIKCSIGSLFEPWNTRKVSRLSKCSKQSEEVRLLGVSCHMTMYKICIMPVTWLDLLC